MRVLIFGSRNLTWKHVEVMHRVASHALLAEDMGFSEFVRLYSEIPASEHGHEWEWLPDSESLVLLNGDGPPGSGVRGSIGADKLAVFACMQRWPERRRVKWFPPEAKAKDDGSMESWGEAAVRRDVEMAEACPDKAYCVHEDLDRSKGSAVTARALTSRGIPFWHVKVDPSGKVLKVERR